MVETKQNKRMSGKKRFVILIWNMGIGGVQKRVRDILYDLADHHLDWDIYLLVKFKGGNEFIDDRIQSSRVKISYFSLSHQKSNALPSVFWIAGEIITIKPNVVLTFLDHLSVVMIILKYAFFWLGIRVVINEGVLTSVYLSISRKFYWKYLVRIAYPLADLVITPTHAGKRDLRDHFGVSENIIRVIPSWTLFRPYFPRTTTWDLIYIGRFEKEKNIFALIPIVAMLKKYRPDISLLMVGKGRQEDDLRIAISAAGLDRNIHIHSFSAQVADLLRRAKLFVLMTNNEGLPNVVLEAAMCGLPSVVNNFIGADEVVIHGKTGYIAKDNSTACAYILRLLRNTRLRLKMGNIARINVSKKFGMERQSEFISAVLSN